MKTFLVYFCLVFLPLSVAAQNALAESWNQVKTEMTARTHTIREFTRVVGKSNKIRRPDVETINQRVLQLESFLRIPDLNPEYLREIKGVHNDLSEYIGKLYVGAEQDIDLKSNASFLQLSDRLAAHDKKLKAAIDRYNALCKESGRQELIF